MSLNKVTLIGHVANDVTAHYTAAGMCITRLTLATNEYWVDKQGEKQSSAEFNRCVCFNKVAEIAEEYVSKGQQIAVEGKLSTRSYDKEGVTHYTTEIIVTNLILLGKSTDKAHRKQPAKDAPKATAEDIATDEIPF